MREILKENLDAQFQSIAEDFENAAFFAIDGEFSGLLVMDKLSRFDTIEQRYAVQRQGMENYIILQMGITAFHFNSQTNSYLPSTYNFYVFPQSCGEIDFDFICKTSSIEFLCQYEFDFNKLFYHGVPYLDHQQEKDLQNNPTDLLKSLKQNLRIEEKFVIQKLCSEISHWLASNKTTSTTEKPDLDQEKTNKHEQTCKDKSKIQDDSEGSNDKDLRAELDDLKSKEPFTDKDDESSNNESSDSVNGDLSYSEKNTSETRDQESQDKLNSSGELENLVSKSKLISNGTSSSSGNDETENKKQTDKKILNDSPGRCSRSKESLEKVFLDEESKCLQIKDDLNFNVKSNTDGTRKRLDLSIKLTPILAYLTYCEIRQRFPHVTIYPGNDMIHLEIDSNPQAAPSSNSSFDNMFQDKVMGSLKGFTRVFDLLVELKKPIVGHNSFSDLMMMCKQFHGPLPSTYQDFKKVVHSLFPLIYDTKFLSHELKRRFRKKFREQRPWRTNSLEGLYDYFRNQGENDFCFYPPNILACDGVSDQDVASGRFHNAAWDSFCAGYVFIRMVHLLATLSEEKKLETRMLCSDEHLAIVKQYANHVNIIQGDIRYTVLDGGDPMTNNRVKLIVQTRKNKPLDIAKLAELCSRHGTIDVKQSGKFTAFLIVSGRGPYIGITRSMRNHPDFKVARYSPFQHNPNIRLCLWCLGVLSAGVSGYLLYKAVTE